MSVSGLCDVDDSLKTELCWLSKVLANVFTSATELDVVHLEVALLIQLEGVGLIWSTLGYCKDKEICSLLGIP
jgi:hypothetical protein